MQCLNEPYGKRSSQEFEKCSQAVFYEHVYAAPIIPWETDIDEAGKRTRKTMYKY